jgi:hypothetical protein
VPTGLRRVSAVSAGLGSGPLAPVAPGYSVAVGSLGYAAAITSMTRATAPRGLVAQVRNRQVHVRWTTPAFHGPTRITSYVVGVPAENLRSTVASTTLHKSLTGLRDSRRVAVTVSAVNTAGAGAAARRYARP